MKNLRAALVGVLALGACGEDADPQAPSSEIELGDFCEAMAETSCRRIASCGYDSSAFDEGACRAYQRTVQCEPFVRAVARAEQAGELSWLATVGRRCVEALGGMSCERGVVVDFLDVPECAAALAPLAEVGRACTFVTSCVDGSFCDAGMMCPGTCRAIAGVNETCGATTPCVEGAFCALTANRCQAQSDLGAACETLALGSSCRPGSFCDGSQPGGAVCVAGRGRNQGCQRDAECAVDTRCIANRCSAGRPGDSCADDLSCAGGSRCAQGRCVTPVAQGETCAVDGNCAFGLRCNGTCEVGANDGDSCTANGDCASGRCAMDTCLGAFSDGQACTDARECLPGRICQEGACRAVGPFCPI